MCCYRVEVFAVICDEHPLIGTAEFMCFLQNRVESKPLDVDDRSRARLRCQFRGGPVSTLTAGRKRFQQLLQSLFRGAHHQGTGKPSQPRRALLHRTGFT